MPRLRNPLAAVAGWMLAATLGACPGQLAAASPEGSAAVGDDRPSFSRHVVPLFSRLGCNAGLCHGAVQGRNGFRLSLFGADPGLDHERLLREFAGRRLNRENPDQSLLLLKATGQVPHEGGIRTAIGSAEHQLLRTWIAQGAPLDPLEKSRVAKLQVMPEQQSMKLGAIARLRVMATFADGSMEDVTGLSVFESLDASVAQVDSSGQVKASGTGDTALVIRYRGQPVAATVLVPGESAGALPEAKPHNFIDQHIFDKLRQLNLRPSELCDDAAFLRRASLDVTGTLPQPEEIRAFLADVAPDKRAKKIDELLERPGYAELWATKFSDYLRLSGFTPESFAHSVPKEYRAYEWIRARLRENLPYDQFAERVLTATSREGRDEDDWVKEATALALEEASGDPLTRYSERRTLDLFWMRRVSTDVDHGVRVAHAFLGLRLQCAQCHRHPSDVWSQDDLLSFANFFSRLPTNNRGAGFSTRGPEFEAFKKKKVAELEAQMKEPAAKEGAAKGGAAKGSPAAAALGQMLGSEIYLMPDVADKAGKLRRARVTSPLGTQTSENYRLLGKAEGLRPAEGTDPRTLVAAWLREPDNPFFAKAIVNRVWAHYLGRGIIDPPDQLSPLNPASHPELLAALCKGFIENKYDLKWLHRTMLNSRTYQLSSERTAHNRHDRRNFASFYLRRVPAEQLVDGLDSITGQAPTYAGKGIPAERRLMQGAAITQTGNYFLNLFGRPARDPDVVCDCERQDEASMIQALCLANHPQIRAKIANAKQGRVAELLKKQLPENDQIDELFLWTISRLPTETERKSCRDYLQQAPSAQKGLEGILWGLLNTHEFLFIR